MLSKPLLLLLLLRLYYFYCRGICHLVTSDSSFPVQSRTIIHSWDCNVIALQKILKWNLHSHIICCLTTSSQWSTSNWRNSQRWLSPRAAAHASTPHPHPHLCPPHQQLVSQWPLSPPLAHCHWDGGPVFFSLFNSVTFQSIRVDVHYCIEADYLGGKNVLKSKRLKTRNKFNDMLRFSSSCMALYRTADRHS